MISAKHRFASLPSTADFASNAVAASCPLTLFPVTAFSILLFTEAEQRSGFFLKKKPPCTLSQCQQVNRKRSSQTGSPTRLASNSVDPERKSAKLFL
jgi:hypothetical protein